MKVTQIYFRVHDNLLNQVKCACWARVYHNYKKVNQNVDKSITNMLILSMSKFLPVVAEDSKGRRREMSGIVAVHSHTKPWSQTWKERERHKHED